MAARPSAKKAGRGLREKSAGDNNAKSTRGPQKNIHFLRQGEPASHTNIRPPSKLLTSASEWRMEVDLRKQLHSTLRPDVALWSLSTKTVLLIKLTVPTVLYSTEATSEIQHHACSRIWDCEGLSKISKELAEEAEKASFWPKLNRRDKSCLGNTKTS